MTLLTHDTYFCLRPVTPVHAEDMEAGHGECADAEAGGVRTRSRGTRGGSAGAAGGEDSRIGEAYERDEAGTCLSAQKSPAGRAGVIVRLSRRQARGGGGLWVAGIFVHRADTWRDAAVLHCAALLHGK